MMDKSAMHGLTMTGALVGTVATHNSCNNIDVKTPQVMVIGSCPYEVGWASKRPRAFLVFQDPRDDFRNKSYIGPESKAEKKKHKELRICHLYSWLNFLLRFSLRRFPSFLLIDLKSKTSGLIGTWWINYGGDRSSEAGFEQSTFSTVLFMSLLCTFAWHHLLFAAFFFRNGCYRSILSLIMIGKRVFHYGDVFVLVKHIRDDQDRGKNQVCDGATICKAFL